MSKGIVIFAHNNRQIDYGKIALANACTIKDSMSNNNITLITDDGTANWLYKEYNKEFVDSKFDQIKLIKRRRVLNQKRFYDTRYTKVIETFYNINRNEIYDLSPYDETLVIDADYFICNNVLDQCWKLKYDLQINSQSKDIFSGRKYDEFKRTSEDGIDFYWATVFFFRKTPETRLFFDIVRDVKINWDYYKLIYNIKSPVFRNDHAFSIAIHLFNGMGKNHMISRLPLPYLQHIHGIDELIDVPEKYKFKFLLDKPNEPGKYLACMTEKDNVHIMNKFSLNRLSGKIIERYYD